MVAVLVTKYVVKARVKDVMKVVYISSDADAAKDAAQFAAKVHKDVSISRVTEAA